MPGCPPPLARLVSQMLAKKRDARHAGYDDLTADLLEVREKIRAPMNSIASAPAVAVRPLTPRVVPPPPS
jgi:hypothetical protein